VSNPSGPGIEAIVAPLALRSIACAGVLVGALMLGGAGSGLAAADPSQTGGDGQMSNGASSEGVGTEPSVPGVMGEPEPHAAGAAESPDPPTSTFGSGREPGSPAGSTQDTDGAGSGDKGTLKKGSNGIVMVPVPFLKGVALPVPAVPNFRGGDLAQDTARVMSTLEAAVTPYLPTPPQPTPSPAFRGQMEPDPVPVPVVASGGGGSEATAFGGAAELPVLEAPIVVAPRVSGVTASSSAPQANATSGVLTPRVAGESNAVGSGSSTPAVRARDAQPEAPPAGTATPLGTQSQRLGYPDYLRTVGLRGLFAAALPGLTGIMLFTLGGTAIGYRQARTGQMVRMTPAARMLP
jgi:hypothetical protein